MRLVREWWRVDPGGAVMAVGFTLAIMLGTLSVGLLLRGLQ